MSSASQNNNNDSPISVYVRIRPDSQPNSLQKSSTKNDQKTGHHSGNNIVVVKESERSITLQNGQDSGSGSKSTRSYNFDHVFGPQDGQKLVYDKTTTEVLQEVLNGYSCTIFAYGQTGTGKTYTMTGDTSKEEACGIIPRAIRSLFNYLEDKSIKEHVVRTTFVELYNEELIDLLSAKENCDVKLKLFDDKDGNVKIQGAEDILVHNYDEAMRVFHEGNNKRQKGETLMNIESSRSHAVFILTIFMKETSLDKSEVVKQGKLNLVDLAGSENIGKSGATDKRKREAGNINQSLLTLGRVINSLTDQAPSNHVPYRESKLTRLLKDSLGGKTKTTMIATVSSLASNYDETHSTIEYAFRSKNIKNKPVVNKKVTQLGLIKDMSDELEKARKDLIATQMKNGIYIDPDNYKEMTDKIESLTSQNEQFEKLISEKEKLLDTKNEELKKTTKISDYFEKMAPIYYTKCTNFQQVCQALIDACNNYKEQSLDIATKNLNNIKILQNSTKPAKEIVENLNKVAKEENTKLSEYNAVESESNQREFEETDFWTKKCAFENDQMKNMAKEKLADVESIHSNFLQKIGTYMNEELFHVNHIIQKSNEGKTDLAKELSEFSSASKKQIEDFQQLNMNFLKGMSSSLGKLGESVNELSRLDKVTEEFKTTNSDNHAESSEQIKELKNLLSCALTKIGELESTSKDNFTYFDTKIGQFAKTVTNSRLKSAETIAASSNALEKQFGVSESFFESFCKHIECVLKKFEKSMFDAFVECENMNQGSVNELQRQKKLIEDFTATSFNEFKKFTKEAIQNMLDNFTENYKNQSVSVRKDQKKRCTRLKEFCNTIATLNESSQKSVGKLGALLKQQDDFSFKNVIVNSQKFMSPAMPNALKTKKDILGADENTDPSEQPLAKRKKSQ